MDIPRRPSKDGILFRSEDIMAFFKGVCTLDVDI
jgi:hypothetical protein